MNGHSHLGTEGAQTRKNHNGIQRRATSREMPQLSHRGSSTTISNITGSCSSIDHDPSSPDFVESGPSSEQLKRRKDHNHKSTLTEHQYSSSPNFFSSSKDSLGVGSSGGKGGTSSSLMKLSERYDSSLSLYSVASLTSSSSGALLAGGGEDCRQEAAIMDLYILKQSSDFYHQLCVAWANIKIVSFL